MSHIPIQGHYKTGKVAHYKRDTYGCKKVVLIENPYVDVVHQTSVSGVYSSVSGRLLDGSSFKCTIRELLGISSTTN